MDSGGGSPATCLLRDTILLVARLRREARRDHGARDREKTNNEKLRYYLADLSSLDGVRRLAEEVRADYDRLVILINNARGVCSRTGYLQGWPRANLRC